MPSLENNAFDSDARSLSRLLKGKKVLFLSHTRPDLDTLSSAHALTLFFSTIAKTTWGVDQSLSSETKSRIGFLEKQPVVIASLDSFDVVVCVDFRSPNQAGDLSETFRSFEGDVILLDHHHPSTREFSRIKQFILRPDSASTAQMVAQIGMTINASFSKPTAFFLAAAMVSDSARFAFANMETFRVFDFLLEKSEKTYEEVLAQAIPTVSISHRVSVFRAIKNAKLVGVGNYLLALVDAPYENAPAANAMIQMGADISIGIFRGATGVFASIRVSNRAHRDIQLDAMKIILPFAIEHHATAGGHARAAQINLPPYFSETVLLDLFSRELLMRVRKTDASAKMMIY